MLLHQDEVSSAAGNSAFSGRVAGRRSQAGGTQPPSEAERGGLLEWLRASALELDKLRQPVLVLRRLPLGRLLYSPRTQGREGEA